jgi:CheY-like chemotaxis protein
MRKITCIMLIDDNADDNFFHERVIRKNDAAHLIVSKQSGEEALKYLSENHLSNPKPDLIFLDINMPGMNGWEFFQKFNELAGNQKEKPIIVFLTTSENPDDQKKATDLNAGFKTKPLTGEMLADVIDHYFHNT